MADAFIAIDWGTSSWRGALLDAAGTVIDERQAPRGILSVEPGGFEAAWRALCHGWLDDASVPCLISGMAGSRQGWVEAPYAPCPAGFADLAPLLTWIAQADGRRVGIVPGLRCDHDGGPDVMRGEELQIFGAAHLLGLDSGLFVLPGTHSKWATLDGSRINGFRTRMTGELYALLRSHSILARLMPDLTGPQADEFDQTAFCQGARAAQSADVLGQLFSVRTLGLFGQLGPQALPSYLSGLLVGEEFRAALQRHAPVGAPVGTTVDAPVRQIVLVGSGVLVTRYARAAEELGLQTTTPTGNATWTGLAMLARHVFD